MPLETRLTTGVLLAVLLVYLVTPLAIRVADRLEFYDQPVGYKAHGHPTPYLGGAAVIVGFAAVLLLLTTDWGRTAPVLGGAAALWLLGTVDDRRTTTPALRVAVEVTLATGLWALGLGWDLGFGPAVDLVVTAFWLVAVINAFNFFDNMDGAATSMAAVVAAGIAVLGLAEGDAWLTVAAAALCGACLGFLPHNLIASPARIFLGDGGSMPIGFAIGALTMIGTAGAAAEWQSLAMGLLLVGVPALDTALVIVSRVRQRIPILTGGRDHMTHRTLGRVRTARAVALVLGSAQALVSALALVAIGAGPAAVLFAVALYIIAACTAIVVFDTRLRVTAPVPAEIVGARAERERAAPGRRARTLLLVAVGALAGLSPFFYGYYSSGLWAPGGLVLLALAAAIAVARPVRPSGPQALALAGLGGLGGLCLVSVAWSPSAELAAVAGNRYMVLAALLGVLVLLVRSSADGKHLLAAVSATGCVTAAVVLARLLAGDESLFLGARLNAPLGYINGEAAFFGLLIWPCVAAAEQRRSWWVAGGGLAAATALAGLATLSQSRGATLGAAAAILVILALIPGRLHRLMLLGVVAACLAPALPFLLDVYQARAGGLDGAAEMTRAAVAIAIAAAVAGALGAATCAMPAFARVLRVAVAAVLAMALVAGTGLVIAQHARIVDDIERQADAFRSPGAASDSSASSRLTTGAGNRYDYWRIAVHTWRDDPLLGIGAGGYEVPYFRERVTLEDVRQPHSLPLQVLSELGLAGAVLLALFLAALGWGAVRTIRAAREATDARLLAVAGVGTATAWLVHTSVDWLHLLPGVTAVALCAAAPLMLPAVRAPATAAVAGRGRVSLLAAAAVAVTLVVAAVSLGRQALAEHFLDQGRSALAADPVQALREADRSLRIQPEGTEAYRLKAAALARYGQADASRAVLAEALGRRPEDWVTWALLGDLEVRAGNRSAAARAYGRAADLNPRDGGLRKLAERQRP